MRLITLVPSMTRTKPQGNTRTPDKKYFQIHLSVKIFTTANQASKMGFERSVL